MIAHKTIHRLKQRPHHERRAVALFVAMGVVVVTFFGWMFAFFAGLDTGAVGTPAASETAATAIPSEIVTPTTFTNSGQSGLGQ